MNPDILDTWTPELPGLFNKVLDTIPRLAAQKGFIEPKSSMKARALFEGAGNPAKNFLREEADVNHPNDKLKYRARLVEVKDRYILHCEENGLTPMRPGDFIKALESIPGIYRDKVDIKVKDLNSGGKTKYKAVKCWVGFRLKGTSGNITLENQVDGPEF
jgi:hypothetical protein